LNLCVSQELRIEQIFKQAFYELGMLISR
jgi:hypothetical protein